MYFKYVVALVVVYGKEMEVPFIFPGSILHKDFAAAVWPTIRLYGPEDTKEWVSAGEIRLADLHCFGDSLSMGLVSRGKQDSELIGLYPLTKGYRSNL